MPGAVVDRLGLFGVFLGGFLLARVEAAAASVLPWLYVVLGDVACAIEQRGDLAAGGGEFGLGLALALDRGVDDRAPPFLVGRDGLAFEVLQLFDQGAPRLFVFGVGRGRARDRVRSSTLASASARSATRRRISRRTARSRSRIGRLGSAPRATGPGLGVGVRTGRSFAGRWSSCSQ